MFTIFPLIGAILLSLWLILRAKARSQTMELNASLLAQLEAMDADLTRLEMDADDTDREWRKLERSQKKAQQRAPASPIPQNLRAVTQQPSALPPLSASAVGPVPELAAPELAAPEKTIPRPPRKRESSRISKAPEDFEAARRRLPPTPVHIADSQAVEHFSEPNSLPFQSTSFETQVNPRPSVAESPLLKKQSLFNRCLTPLRVVAHCLSSFFTPLRRIPNLFSSWFSRPKPPPQSIAPPQNLAA